MTSVDPRAAIASSFVIDGNSFDPEAISIGTGMKPTKIWRAWHPAVARCAAFPQLAWIFEIPRRPSASLDEAIRESIAPFLPKSAWICSFLERNKAAAHVICNLYGDTSTVELRVDSVTVSELGRLCCGLSFSLNS